MYLLIVAKSYSYCSERNKAQRQFQEEFIFVVVALVSCQLMLEIGGKHGHDIIPPYYVAICDLTSKMKNVELLSSNFECFHI